MKILYLDAFSGISGNMILGSLFDAGLDFNAWKNKLECLRLENYEVAIKSVQKHGIKALHFEVTTQKEHAHRHLHDLVSIVEKSTLSRWVKDQSSLVFTNLAQAEAAVHGCSIEEIHFHEVGALDAIIDIVGAMIAVEMLNITEIICSSIRVGSGLVEMEHGLMPIPAPATAYLLKDIPTYSGNVAGEFTTPTGAAVIKTICHSFQSQPTMKVCQIGYGAGTRNYAHPNVLRAFIGECDGNKVVEEIWMLETDLDDITSEVSAYVMEKLFELGALDVTLTRTHMKKGRPGIRFTVLSSHEKKVELTQFLLNETSTFGVRYSLMGRTKLIPTMQSIQTKFGLIAAKIVTRDCHETVAPEFEDCRRAAESNKVSLQEVYNEAIWQHYKNLSTDTEGT